MLELDSVHMTLTWKGVESRELTGPEYRILSVLGDRFDEGVTEGEFYSSVWKHAFVTDKVLCVHLINVLRKVGHLGLFIVFDPLLKRYFLKSTSSSRGRSGCSQG